MMEVLQPFFAHDPAETHTSFLRRLSFFHTGQGPNRLLTDLGLDPREVEHGSPEMVRRLAGIVRVDPAELAAITIGRPARCRSFRGERWSRDFVIPEGARLCPQCLLEDARMAGPAQQRFQISWRLRPVLICLRHGRELVQCPGVAGKGDLSARFVGIQELEDFVDKAAPLTPTPLERWIGARLDLCDHDSHPWMSGQTIEQVARLSEMLGAVLDHGHKVNIKAMSASSLRLCAVTGFEIVSNGPKRVMAALDEIRHSAPSTAGQAGPRAKYGRIYEWLAYTTPVVDHGPIVDLLREHILEHTAIEPGERLLGKEITRRRMHSVHSLSIATRMHRKRLRKVLEVKGLVPPDCSETALNHLVFPAQETEKLCLDLQNAIPLSRLPEFIGCTRTQASSLYKEKVLHPVVDGSAKHGLGRVDFAQADVMRLLDRLQDLPRPVAGLEVVNLTIATKKTRRSTGELLNAILNGRLSAFHATGATGLSGVRIPAAALQAFGLEVAKTLV